jgi:hypothetical protein
MQLAACPEERSDEGLAVGKNISGVGNISRLMGINIKFFLFLTDFTNNIKAFES